MTFLKSGHSFSKDLEFVRNISEKIDRKLSQSNNSINTKIDKLSLEELQDLGKIVRIADFMLFKYEDKKETCSLLKNFVSIIRDSAESIEEIDDEVSELIISAEDSINKLKEIHTNVSEKYDLEKSDMYANGYPVALLASADDLDNRGLISIATYLSEFGSKAY